jgi:BarA-like signal transduction histidine kinase
MKEAVNKKHVLDFIDTELKSMQRSIVATPGTRAQLESFAQANQGSSDMVLMQMAIQFGYKMALQNLQLDIKNRPDSKLV